MSTTNQIEQTEQIKKGIIDWLTTVAIAAIAISLTQIIHEGTHALTCLITGGDLQEFSALHAACQANSAT